jgi:hypothetical protein
MAGFDVTDQVEQGRARDVSAGSSVPPRERVDPVPDAEAHHRVPGGVELDLVDALTEPIVAAKHRGVRVRLIPPDEGLAPDQFTDLAHLLVRPPRSFPLEGLDDRAVRAEEVVALERRRLVDARHRHGASSSRTRASSDRMRIDSNIARLRVRWRRALSSSPA